MVLVLWYVDLFYTPFEVLISVRLILGSEHGDGEVDHSYHLQYALGVCILSVSKDITLATSSHKNIVTTHAKLPRNSTSLTSTALELVCFIEFRKCPTILILVKVAEWKTSYWIIHTPNVCRSFFNRVLPRDHTVEQEELNRVQFYRPTFMDVRHKFLLLIRPLWRAFAPQYTTFTVSFDKHASRSG